MWDISRGARFWRFCNSLCAVPHHGETSAQVENPLGVQAICWVSRQCARWVSRPSACGVCRQSAGGGQDLTSCVTPWTPCPARRRPLPRRRSAASPATKTCRKHDGTWASWIATWQGKDPKWSIGWSRTARRLPLQSPGCAGRPTTGSPPAQGEHQQAEAPERRDPASHPRGAHLPQRRVVPCLGARPSRPDREEPTRMPCSRQRRAEIDASAGRVARAANPLPQP